MNSTKQRELSFATKNRILGMITAGCSYSTVAKQFGVSKSVISYWVKRDRETGSVAKAKRCGTKRKTTDRQDAAMVNRHEEDPFTPTKTTANDFEVSCSTVRRRLKLKGLNCRVPYVGQVLKQEHLDARLQWGINKRRWFGPQWEQVLFSDESRFNINFNDGRINIRRHSGTRFDPKCVKEVDRYEEG